MSEGLVRARRSVDVPSTSKKSVRFHGDQVWSTVPDILAVIYDTHHRVVARKQDAKNEGGKKEKKISLPFAVLSSSITLIHPITHTNPPIHPAKLSMHPINQHPSNQSTNSPPKLPSSSLPPSFLTPSLPHFLPPSLPSSLISFLLPSLTSSLPHFLPPSLPSSLPHFLPPSLPPSLISSLQTITNLRSRYLENISKLSSRDRILSANSSPVGSSIRAMVCAYIREPMVNI